jgi:predicted amidohydrolase YtcJ
MKNLFLLSFIVLSQSSCVKFKTADLVIHNARIYTVNEEFEVAQAMAIKDGKIIAIGKEHEIMNKYRADELLDVETRPIYPGFMDGHCHFLGSGLNSLGVDLNKCKSMVEIIEKLKSFQTKDQDMKWLVGYGWDENKWDNPEIDNQLLNEIFSTIPVLLWRVDGHSLIVNDAAIAKTGIDFEQSIGLISEEFIPDFTRAIQYTNPQKKLALRFAEENFFSKGVTTVSDAGLLVDEVKLIHSMQESETLNMNVYAMLYFSKEASFFIPFGDFNRLITNTYKVILDGSVGSQTACFKQPYKGTNNYGKLLMTKDSLRRVCSIAYNQGAQLAIHAIGDSAVKVALEVMGEVLQGTNGMGWRIEHAQAVDEAELELFRKYSIIPSVQPTHLEDDKDMVEKNLTASQLANSYRLRSLLELNQTIPLGTDYPVASNNPIHTFYNAVFRPNKPWILQSESLSREEALKGITFWVALANKSYEKNGSLEVGKQADFVILDRDIMKIPKEEIKATEVLKTYSSGMLVFEKLN